MDQIYSKAHFTIAAVSSTSPNSGLFSADHSAHFATEIKPYNLYSRQRIPHVSHLLGGVPGDDPPDEFPLFRPAWVVQEMLLSPRILYFTAHVRPLDIVCSTLL